MQGEGDLASVGDRLTSLESRMEEAVVKLPTAEFRPASIAKEALRALVSLGQDAVAGLIWLIIVGGGIAVPVVLLVIVVRALILRRRR